MQMKQKSHSACRLRIYRKLGNRSKGGASEPGSSIVFGSQIMATEVRHTVNLILRQGKIQTTKSPLEQFHVGERIRIRSPAKYHLEYALRSFKRRSPQIFVTVVSSTCRQEQPGLPFMKRTATILSEPENNRNCYCQHLSTRTTGPTIHATHGCDSTLDPFFLLDV